MRFTVLAALALLATPVAAQEREVPYWASIKAAVLNLRAGPGRDYIVNKRSSKMPHIIPANRMSESARCEFMQNNFGVFVTMPHQSA